MKTILLLILVVILMIFITKYLFRYWKEDYTIFDRIIKSAEFINSPEKKTIQSTITIDNRSKEIFFYKYNAVKFIILVKTSQKYKSNFEGICYSTFDEDIIKSTNNREYFSINHAGIFEELYIKRKISHQYYKIYFDLN
jgi:hypothetical protein